MQLLLVFVPGIWTFHCSSSRSTIAEAHWLQLLHAVTSAAAAPPHLPLDGFTPIFDAVCYLLPLRVGRCEAMEPRHPSVQLIYLRPTEAAGSAAASTTSCSWFGWWLAGAYRVLYLLPGQIEGIMRHGCCLCCSFKTRMWLAEWCHGLLFCWAGKGAPRAKLHPGLQWLGM
jgi:hypothetical protein